MIGYGLVGAVTTPLEAIGQATADGFVFRVDLRLRPEGQRGPLAQSLGGYEIYYESWGQTWERSALIKARPVAGDEAVGREFLARITPFVYRKYLDFGAIAEIRDMKVKINREVQLKGSTQRDVKLGYGGIREIEFLVQALQLIYGGRDRAFVAPRESEHHYVMAGRVTTVLLFLVSSGMVYLLDSAKDAFDLVLQVGAGTGLLYLVRWFWWRVNAWCEVVAMASSFLMSIGFLILAKNGIHFSTHRALILTVIATTVCWIATAYLAPQTDRKVLVDFFCRVRPAGPGWAPVRQVSGLSKAELAATGDHIPMALLGWLAGCTLVWSGLFLVGNVLYGRTGTALFLLVIVALSGWALTRIVQRLWASSDAEA